MLSLTAEALLFYALAMAVLFIVPGPVWVMLIAQAMRGGFRAGLAIAIGVGIGDLIWPVLALLSLNQLASFHGDVMSWLHLIAAGVFCIMGVMLWRSDVTLSAFEPALKQQQKTAYKFWGGIVAGLAVVTGNPKAILFYLGILPGFFDITTLTISDMIAICVLSAGVPFIGNLLLSGLVDKATYLLTSERAQRVLNRSMSVMMVGVGCALFTGLI